MREATAIPEIDKLFRIPSEGSDVRSMGAVGREIIEPGSEVIVSKNRVTIDHRKNKLQLISWSKDCVGCWIQQSALQEAIGIKNRSSK